MELTAIWPPFPIIITNMVDWPMPEDFDFDAAVMHHSRVCEINLRLTSSQLQRLASAMQRQFPALIHLGLDSSSRPTPPLPDGFLVGSTPRLRTLELDSIPFPTLPKLLSSPIDLVRLELRNIPHSGYFAPEAIVTSLAVLANLKSLIIEFESPLSCPDRARRRPPPPTRTVLPALTHFRFRGVSEYLEDVIARIDAPLLDAIWITFSHQLTFHIPELARFMRRTTNFNALTGNEVYLSVDYDILAQSVPPMRGFKNIATQKKCRQTTGEKSGLRISCRNLDWQLSSLAQVLTSFFPSIDTVERLYIYEPQYLPSKWQDDVENVQWLEIFHQFTSVKNLYICKEFTQCIALALQELVGERVADALPALEVLWLEELQPSGPVQEGIERFVAARRLSSHPVAVSHWSGTRETILPRFL